MWDEFGQVLQRVHELNQQDSSRRSSASRSSANGNASLLAVGDEFGAPLSERLEQACRNIKKDGGLDVEALNATATPASARFHTELTQLVLGPAAASVKGILSFMHADEQAVMKCLAHDHGVAAIEKEINARGTPTDRECVAYVLHGQTGKSQRVFQNGVMDSTRPPGMRLADFLKTPQAKAANLTLGHVLALRLYTTQCYHSLNTPLRAAMSKAKPHPFPVTIHLLTEGIKRLRAVDGETEAGRASKVLWRGLRNVEIG